MTPLTSIHKVYNISDNQKVIMNICQSGTHLDVIKLSLSHYQDHAPVMTFESYIPCNMKISKKIMDQIVTIFTLELQIKKQLVTNLVNMIREEYENEYIYCN